jgi:hypothetical protein
MRDRIRFFAQRNFRRNGIELRAALEHADGRVSVALPSVFQTFEDAGAEWTPPLLTLEQDAAQSLMDELYSAGVRPTAGQGSAGQLDAVQRHLADMRTLAFARLRVELPKT